MPTVRENIAYTFEHFMLVYRGTLLKVARAVAVIALVALALEVFVFNINFFTSSGYRTINLDDRIQLQRNDDGRLSAHRRGSHARVLQPEHRGAQHPHRF